MEAKTSEKLNNSIIHINFNTKKILHFAKLFIFAFITALLLLLQISLLILANLRFFFEILLYSHPFCCMGIFNSYYYVNYGFKYQIFCSDAYV